MIATPTLTLKHIDSTNMQLCGTRLDSPSLAVTSSLLDKSDVASESQSEVAYIFPTLVELHASVTLQ